MGFDGLGADAVFFGYFAGGKSLADQPENFKFPVAESIQYGAGTFFLGDKITRELEGKRLAQIDFVFKDAPDRREEILGRGLFHDVALCAGTKHSFGVEGFVVHRKHQHPERGEADFQRLDQVQAAEAGQRDIDNGKFRGRGLDRVESLSGAFDFSANLQVRLSFQHASQAVSENGMVIDEEYSPFAFRGSFF